MGVDLFAGIPISDYAVALEWHEQLFGSLPSLVSIDTEAVWEVAPQEALEKRGWSFARERSAGAATNHRGSAK